MISQNQNKNRNKRFPFRTHGSGKNGDALRKRRNSKLFRMLSVVGIVVIILILIALSVLIKKYTPSKEKADYASYYNLTDSDSMYVVYDNKLADKNGIYVDGEAYISYETVKTLINSRFYWDSTEKILRYATPGAIVSVGADTTEYSVAKVKKTADKKIVLVEGDTMYLSLSFIEKYTNVHSDVYSKPNRVVISDKWGDVSFNEVRKDTQIREKGGIKSPVLTNLKKGDLVTQTETEGSWIKVCSKNGFVGYMKKSALGAEQKVNYDSSFTEPTFQHITKDFKINLAWQQITNRLANQSIASKLSSAPGVNVISPTWFYLNDNKGGIASLASTDYVSYCHQKGVEVWALVSNLEDSSVNTAKVLNRTSSRDKLVNTLVASAIEYDLDGINVDFEALSSDGGNGFIEFIRELSIKCENNGIVLSVDNYVPSSYTKIYQRAEQAVFADYVVLMAYDEHYSGSEEGSVASLSYVKTGVQNTLKEVPAKQLILGIPFYTRVWKETPDKSEESGYKLSSEAVSMSEAESRIAANGATAKWLSKEGQYYATYKNNGSTYKIWLEDQNSIAQKLTVMKNNNLAGAAFWKLGYEKSTVWETVSSYLENK